MKKRIVWLVVSGLMALSLVVTSCAPKVTEEKEVVTGEKKEVVTEEKKEVAAEKVVVVKKEVPQYGGVLNVVTGSEPTLGVSHTELFSASPSRWELRVTNDTLFGYDRSKNPGGSGELSGLSIMPPLSALEANLAESWEIIQPDTIIFKIRQGIHWQDKPPTNGMEFTAEDVVYTFMVAYARSVTAWTRLYPFLSNLKNPAESVYVHPDDPWAVVFKSPPDQLAGLFEHAALFPVIMPKALGDINGEGFVDWKGLVGTGAMLLTDYVRGSAMTFKRNPNYWKKDSLHPENQLPYLDGMKMFFIPDLSTQHAALRTGKIDLIGELAGIEAEDAESLFRTNPKLLRYERWGEAPALHMRVDKPPFSNVKVRRAMTMAIDYDEMVRDLYGGKANKFWWPAFPFGEQADFYRPLEEMPESVKELYTYNPDKTKQLLKEAGYPDGFTTSVVVSAAQEEHIDLAAIVAAYWAKVGVNLEIQVKEPTVYATIGRRHTHEYGYFATIPFNPTWFLRERVGSPGNTAQINEPLLEATRLGVIANYFDRAEYARIMREATPALIDLALHQRLPQPLVYSVWQPWLGGYGGEAYPRGSFRMQPLSEYAWIDQALKKSMGR